MHGSYPSQGGRERCRLPRGQGGRALLRAGGVTRRRRAVGDRAAVQNRALVFGSRGWKRLEPASCFMNFLL